MKGPLTGWRVLLRIAWRDVVRNKARSALILVMIALPVFAVVAGLVVSSTQDVTTREGLDRQLGRADAFLQITDVPRVVQSPDPYDYGEFSWSEDPTSGEERGPLATAADITAILGPKARLLPHHEDYATALLDGKSLSVQTIGADLREKAFDGTYTLVEGRLPERKGEILVNPYTVERGAQVGSHISLSTVSTPLEVVGIAEDRTYREPGHAWGLPETFPASTPVPDSDYLVEVPGGVSWQQVLDLNKEGVVVLSREVILDPPAHPEKDYPGDPINYLDSGDDQIFAIVILVATMAALEVILLAGPAFAVGARRMQRNLAQMAATGASPAQVRRAVLATAVVLGGIAAGAGLLLGLGAGAIAAPIVESFGSQVFGPFDVVWSQVLAVALLGWVSAVIAALVPAWLASRQDVVKVLAGRRGDTAPSAVSPVLGALLFAAGVAAAWHGTGNVLDGEIWIATGAVLIVVGAVLLLPPVVALLGHLARRAPLPLRYAVRDAARHRTRTVPAIGAVVATVAGVVALGIAGTSDKEQDEKSYVPLTASGAGVVQYWSDTTEGEERADDWRTIAATTEKDFPDAVALTSFAREWGPYGPRNDIMLPDDSAMLLGESRDTYGQWIVADKVPDVELFLEDEGDRAVMDAALAAGKVVLFSDGQGERMSEEMGRDYALPEKAVLQNYGYDDQGDGTVVKTVTAPAAVIEVEHGTSQGIVPPAVARQTGVSLGTAALVIPGPVARADELALQKAIKAEGVAGVDVYVERGWQGGNDLALAMLLLAAVGGLLMIGGTLTATFLALSDAAPDLATLGAVGAAPRERRLVAACYALVVGGVGAVVGAVVGLIPGIAATWPLTAYGWSPDGVAQHYLDIPWLLILGVVVGLPLLTALVVGLCARSRLPLVARID